MAADSYVRYLELAAAVRTAGEPLSRYELRRFAQATMDDQPMAWDGAAAIAAGHSGPVAPPLYPVHAVRRAAGTPDPLARASAEHDWDGSEYDSLWHGLPAVEAPLHRHLNGGSEIEFHSLAEAGETIEESSRYTAIEEKEGRSGPMLLTTVETRYRVGDRPLLTVRMTVVRR
jgi:acyl dehydratase